MRVLIDTNVILDVLCNRAEHVEASSMVMKHCELKKIEGYVSALSFPNIVYILRKELTPEKTKEIISNLGMIFTVADLKADDLKKSAGFISEDKTEELINKLARLGGGYKTELLKSNLVRFNIRKHSNEAVYDNVEKLEEALRQRRKASFCYFDLNENAERVYRREHERYIQNLA